MNAGRKPDHEVISVAVVGPAAMVRGMVADLSHVAVLALLGSGHCVGMCGAFALAAGTGEGGRGRWWARMLSYQLGKGAAYVFVGVALLAAMRLLQTRAPIDQVQTAIGWGVGLIMIGLGAGMLLERRLPQRWLRWIQGSATCGVMASLGRSGSPFKGLLIGWINGFLPCGLSLAALLYLIGTQSVATVVMGAFVFSLATMPGLAATAWLLPRLGGPGRRRLTLLAGVVLIALGLLTIVRGNDRVHHWFHEHLIWSPGGKSAPAEHGQHSH